MSEERPYSVHADGVRLAVRLTPRASRDARGDVVKDAAGRLALQLKVTAAPTGGEANDAAIGFLAKELRLRRSDVSIETGHTARWKILRLRGDAADLVARLEAWMAR